jgi:hypothetical protein
MALSRETKAKLLAKVRAGHDVESACAELSLKPEQVRRDAVLMEEIGEAFKTGTARLRARLLDGALKTNDLRVLSSLLEERQAAQLKAEAERPKAPARTREDLFEQIAQVFEHLLQDDPIGVLPRYIEAAFSTGKLDPAAVEAGQALMAALGSHPPLKYSAEWWAAERAAGRNGYCQVTPPAKPAAPEPEVIPPERLKVLDATQPLPSNRAPAVRTRVPPAPPAVMEKWYGANWADSPWSW